ncbi:hypothetical protein [Streptomyces sp. JB150]|uniref:hypothetical protein n=1 Tax=Streptomyces sp. JB150 TaxID=2714844 RepID=UPI001408AAA0|nr:hypothetical protein [Streptomyces sp. JB150]QIJ60597.1 hypothetical protein G7Z13_29080 [Streptomyces sp. JB150]
MSVAVLTATAAGGAAAGALAEPAAEVSPGQAAPGATVTVSVTCDPLDGSAPDAIDATSMAFEDGLAELRLVTGKDDKAIKAVYRGTARIVLPEDFEDGKPPGGPLAGPEPATDGPAAAEPVPDEPVAEEPVPDEPVAEEPVPDEPIVDEPATGQLTATGQAAGEDPAGGHTTDKEVTDKEATGEDSAWTVDGTCPAPHGGEGKPWSATFTVPASTDSGAGGWSGGAGSGGGHSATPCPDLKDPGCGTATVQRGVRAGAGGAFGVSVPALVLGGLLIVGALGAAAHRLYGRASGTDG